MKKELSRVSSRELRKDRFNLLTLKIKAKLAKGKSFELIADELEEDISVIEKLLNQEAN